MENSNNIAQKLGTIGKILNPLIPHSVYPTSVTELKNDSSEITYNSKKSLFKNMVLAKLDSCYFLPNDEKTGRISDLETEIEVNISKLKTTPKPQEQINNVLLKYTPTNTMPELVKYK